MKKLAKWAIKTGVALVAFLALLIGGRILVGWMVAPEPRPLDPTDGALRARALALHREALVLDGHNDLPTWILDFGFDLAMDGDEPSDRSPLLYAGLTWLPDPPRGDRVRTHTDLARIREGGHAIEGDLEDVATFHRLGVRYLTLTHSCSHAWADSSTDEPISNGLSDFGREVVRDSCPKVGLGWHWFWHPRGTTTPLSILVDHIDHIVVVGGIDHVGLGSDFDGVPWLPEDLEDVGDLPNITVELVRRGYSDGDVRKVLGGNAMRVLREVEAVAAL